MAYRPSSEVLKKATTYLLANPGKKVMPVDLASASNISPISSKRVCKYLNDEGQVIRFGRGYTWNSKGAAASGPMPVIYIVRVLKLTVIVVEEIHQRKLHNKRIGRAYFNGHSDSPLTGRKQILTLEVSLRDLEHLHDHLDWELLLVVEHRMCLDMPDWAGMAYRRTREEAEEVEADGRQEAIDAKLRANRKKTDPAVRAGIAERRTAYLAAQRALKAAAALEKASRLATLVEQIDAAHGPEALIMATQIATRSPEVVERLVNEMHHHIAPASPAESWQTPVPARQEIPA
jgi:hypothetical protein